MTLTWRKSIPPQASLGNGDDSTASPAAVSTVDNHIYYYGGITKDNVLELTKQLRDVDSRMAYEIHQRGLNQALHKHRQITPIYIHIHSYGGDMYAGFAATDAIASVQMPVHAVIEGICASAATLPALACEGTYITPHSFILIHQFTSMVWGTYEQFKDDMRLQDMMMDKLVAFYKAHTSLDTSAIRDMLKRDYWMDADEAFAKGFVQRIVQ